MRTPIKDKLFAALSDGRPRSAREIVDSTGLDKHKVWNCLYYWWEKGLFFRSEEPTYENTKVFKGRRGMTRNTRAYYLYVLKPDRKESFRVQGQNLDVRGARKTASFQLTIYQV